MSRHRFVAILLSLVFASASTVCAQTKTYEVDGQKVRLDVDPNWILLRAKKGVKPYSAVVAGLRAQAQILDADPMPYLRRVTEESAEMIPRIGGVLAPRIEGLQTNQVQTLAERVDGVESSEIVFRYFGPRAVDRAEDNIGRLVLLEGPITVRFQQPPTAQLGVQIRELGYAELERPEYLSHVVRYKPMRPDADPFFACEKIKEFPGVLWAEPDLIYEAQLGDPPKSPNDTHFKKQWYLQSGDAGIHAPEAWMISTGTEAITVAVIDDGVDLKHPDLKDKLVPGYDYLENDNNPQPSPKDSHGTACAGIIGAVTNNDNGVAGIAWDCRIMPLRIGFGRLFSEDAAAKAFRFAHSHGAQVINCSWGGGPPSQKITNAIKEITEGDGACLIVAAAGNARPALDVFFPANYEPCVAVGALHQDNTRWDYSCYGPDNEVDLVAPSGNVNLRGDIWTADHSGANGYNKGGASAEEPSGDTGHFGGTSAATPVVSGVAALIWSNCPKKLSAAQVRDVLEKTATPVDRAQGAWRNGRSKFYGLGKVDALKAMHMTKQICEGEGGNAQGAAALIRLLAALEPTAESYRVDDDRVNLRPNSEWIAVYAEARQSPESCLKNLVRPNMQDSVLSEPIPVSSTGQKVFLVPRSALRDFDELKSAAVSGKLPHIGPVYESRGSFMIPFGTFTTRLKGADTRKAAMEFASQHGLRAVEEEGKTLKFAPDQKSKFTSIFEAIRAFEKTGMAAWVEPDFARSVEKFQDQAAPRARP